MTRQAETWEAQDLNCPPSAYNYPAPPHNRILKVKTATGATAMIHSNRNRKITQNSSVNHLQPPIHQSFTSFKPRKTQFLPNSIPLKTKRLYAYSFRDPMKQSTYRPPNGQKRPFPPSSSRKQQNPARVPVGSPWPRPARLHRLSTRLKHRAEPRPAQVRPPAGC
jgi:hypothetical protein